MRLEVVIVKKKRVLKFIIIFLFLCCGIGYTSYKGYKKYEDKKNGIGETIDAFNGVEVYYNGSEYGSVHGKHYSKDGYYYGYEWQCVEFIKRYYYDYLGHEMPDGYGNAKDFFDDSIPQGEVNEKRGLIQYRNGDNVMPKVNDILIFNDTTYGHIAIISEVEDDYIEVIQQNMGTQTRDKFELKKDGNNYYIGGHRTPAGWLRKE